jgi:hypothetical protein
MARRASKTLAAFSASSSLALWVAVSINEYGSAV